MKALVTRSCLTLCDPTDCSPPGFSVLGILKARILEWIAVSYFMGASWSRDQTQVSCIAGFPGGPSGKEPACQYRRHKRCVFDSWVWKIPCRKAWQPTQVFLPGESHGQRSLAGYSPWGHKESDMTEQPTKSRFK